MVTHSINTADVVVIGGGVIGLSVARALALRGAGTIALIERSHPGSEASSAAAGILAPQAEADCVDDFFDLACQSRTLYRSFASSLLEETGIDVELDNSGTLYLAFTEEDEKEISRRYEWQTRAGLPVERLTAEDARLIEPGISENVRAALRFPLDVQVENRRLLSALVEANQQHSVLLMTGTNVESLRVQRNKLEGIETSRGFISSRNVVIAGGAWTSFLKASDKALPDFRIEPVRGQMLCFDSNPRVSRHVIYSPRGYVVPRINGRLLSGSTTEFAGFDKSVTAFGVHSILTRALEISTLISKLPLIDLWAGLRPHAPDNLPVLGPYKEIEGLFYATGHYRNGILLAPITGELIAEAVCEGIVSPLLASFAPERFTPIGVN